MTIRLEHKVLFIPNMKDEDNEMYIPYCDFQHHKGIPLRPLDCIRKGCFYYQRFYVYENKEK